MIESFDFLRKYKSTQDLYIYYVEAEEDIYIRPNTTVFHCVASVEKTIRDNLYSNLVAKTNVNQYGQKNYASLFEMVNELCVQKIISYNLYSKINSCRHRRNDVCHDFSATTEDAKDCLMAAFEFFRWFVYYHEDPQLDIRNDYYNPPTEIEILARKQSNPEIDKIREEEKKSNQKIIDALQKQHIEEENEIKRLKKEKEDRDARVSNEISEKNKEIAELKKTNAIDKSLSTKEKEQAAKKIGELEGQVADLKEQLINSNHQKFTSTNICSDYTYLNGWGLNENQLEAVKQTDGYVKVVAGPGTGKTKALTCRYAHLIKSKGIRPSEILCITFTNKAAKEMKERVQKLLGDSDYSQICTFHSFARRILADNPDFYNINKYFPILDEDDSNTIVEELVDELSINTKEYPLKALKSGLKDLKNKYRKQYISYLLGYDNTFAKDYVDKSKNKIEKFSGRFLIEQKRQNALQFDDLLNALSYVFNLHPELKEQWQNKIKYIMVDEFQDIDEKQYKFIKVLSSVNKNLFIVGDPNQTIYKWRGANVDYILDFEDDFKDAKVINLNKNYRCTKQIVDVAEASIMHNPQNNYCNLVTFTNGNIPTYYHAPSVELEAEWCIDKIEKLIKDGAERDEIAILYRSANVSHTFQKCLNKRDIKYKVLGSKGFYGLDEIKVILGYLSMVVSDNDLAFKHTITRPLRRFGAKSIKKLKAYQDSYNCSIYEALKENLSNIDSEDVSCYVDLIEYFRRTKDNYLMSELISLLFEQSGYKQFLLDNENYVGIENVMELIHEIQLREEDCLKKSQQMPTIENFLIEISTYSSSDEDKEKDRIVLSTVHAAKGLQYEYVFIVGLEEGKFPLKNGDESEERRLFFVATTRAKNDVYLTDADGEDKYHNKFETSKYIKEVSDTIRII